METETYVTSQGEIIRREVRKDEKKEIMNEGVLSGLWDTVKSTTSGVAHMAEMAAAIAGEAAHNAKDVTAELLDKGMEKAHEAGEMIASTLHIGEEQPKEKERVLSPGGSWRTIHNGIQLHDLAEVIIEQSKEMSAEIGQKASEWTHEVLPVMQHAAEVVVEKGSEVVQAVMHVGEDVAGNVAEMMPEQAKEMVAEVKSSMPEMMKDMAEQAKEVVEQTKEFVGQAVDSLPEPAKDVIEQAKGVVQQVAEKVAPMPEQKSLPRVRSFKRSGSKQSVVAAEPKWNEHTLKLTMDVVSHIQRIADRTGDALLHETARKAHSACAKGLSEAPGVHLTWVTPQQANDLVNLAIRTQDHELADFARYCQSVAATSHIAVEPTPGKIQEEILKGHQELQQQGRVHVGPGYGAAFASISKSYNNVSDSEGPIAPPPSPADQLERPRVVTPQKKPLLVSAKSQAIPEHISNAIPPKLVLNMDVVSHIQRIADRTGNPVLHETARKAHSAFAKGLSDAPGVHLTWITPEQASELMNLASRTGDKELVDFARYCQSVAATTQVGVEPVKNKIQQEIEKGRLEIRQLEQQQLQQQSQQSQHAQPLTQSSTPLEKQVESELVSTMGQASC